MSVWLRLYPRAWRARYGAELEELLAREPRTLRLVIDLVAGALDARLNPQWTPAAASAGEPRMQTFMTSCGRSQFTLAEQRRSAFLMIGVSLALVLAALGYDAVFGRDAASETLLYASFSIACIVSSLPTFLKRYPRNVRASFVVLGSAAFYCFFLAITLLVD